MRLRLAGHQFREHSTQAQGVLAQRLSEWQIARQQLLDTVLYAPISGSIRQRNANVGEYLAAGAPVVTLVQMNPLRLRTEVPERDALNIRAGMMVRVLVDGAAGTHQGRVVRLPVHVVEELNQVTSARRNLERELGYDPEPEEIAASLDMDVDRVLDLLAWGRDHVSLDSPVDEDGDTSLGDLIARAKASPGKLNYPSSGVGTVHHLSGELFNALAGTSITHVPYRGGNAPLTETLAGRVDVLFEAMTLSIGQIQAGKLRPLAVTSRERWKALPDTPTARETLPGYEVNSFIGLGVTGGTPAPLVERLNAAVRKALELPHMRKRFIELGGDPGATSPEEMRAFIASEIEKWKKVVAARNIEKQ